MFLASARELQTWEYVCVQAYGLGANQRKPARGVSHSNGINVSETWEEDCQEVPAVSYHKTMCDTVSEERSNFWELYNKVDKAVELRMRCRTSNSEVVQFKLQQTFSLLAKEAWDLHKNTHKVKGTCVQACDSSSDLPPEQLKRQLSNLDQIAGWKTVWEVSSVQAP